MRLLTNALLATLALLLENCSPGISNISYTHPIPFQPEQYFCQRADQPLTIDGQLQESAWKNAPWTADFQDIEGNLKPVPAHRTHAKMLWDDQYFYVAAQLDEPHLWATLPPCTTTMILKFL